MQRYVYAQGYIIMYIVYVHIHNYISTYTDIYSPNKDFSQRRGSFLIFKQFPWIPGLLGVSSLA